MATMNSRDEALRILGELAISFAGIEHSISILLNHLVQGEELVKPLLIDRMPLAQVIETSKRAAEHYFENDSKTLDSIKSILKRIDSHRAKRNLFIHGQWKIDDTGHANITSFKLKWSEKGFWEYLRQERMPLTKLRQYAKEIVAIRDELRDFVNSLLNIK